MGTFALRVLGYIGRRTGHAGLAVPISQLFPIQLVSGNSRGGGQRGWGQPLWKVSPEVNQPSFSDAKGLSNPSEVETLREKVYATLEAYTKQKYPEQPGR